MAQFASLSKMEDGYPGKEMKHNHRKRQATGEEILSEMDETSRKSFHENSLTGSLPTPGRFMKLPHVFYLLSHSGLSQSSLDSVPPGEKNNVFFIVKNLECTTKIRKGGLNVFHDDCETWDSVKCSKVSTFIGNIDGLWKTILSLENKFYEKKEPLRLLDPQPDMANVARLHRYYAVLKGDEDYKRRITIVSGCGFSDDKALVEYCGVNTINHKTQEHSKKPRRDVHTDPEVTESIKKETKGRPARDICENELTVPKDSYQMHSVEHGPFHKTFKELVTQVHNGKNTILTMLAESSCVQAVINRKGQPPCVILYSEEQLSDMKRNLERDNVLGVDCTYKFGACYVTMTVYQNLRALHTDTNEPRLFLGPVYLHWDNEFLTYLSFFSHIMDKLEGIGPNTEVKIGNDVGLALFKALKFSFPASAHILNCRYLKKTVSRELYDVCNGKASECSIISRKIFGLEGILSSPTLFIFRKRLSDLAPYFLEFPKLRTYFIKLKVILYEHFCEPLQKGVFPKFWEGCRDEIFNSHLQSLLHLKSYELPVLVKKFSAICSLQMQHRGQM